VSDIRKKYIMMLFGTLVWGQYELQKYEIAMFSTLIIIRYVS